MKIDRLLGIIMYLLNRNTVNARELSEHFEVSIRTIQRDIESICAAGIPIYADQGASGGYGIMETYTLNRQIINTDDFFFIITALKGLCSAYENKKIVSTLEKITAYFLNNRKTQNNNLYIDFTSFKESKNIKENFPVIESAIKNNQLLEFDYTSSTHNFTHRLVEPVTIAFKWHAWYLIAYCRKRSDFRLFCISRIRNIIKQNSIFKIREINIEDFFSLSKIHPENNVINLILRFNEEIKVAIEDFFPNGTITENPDNYTLQVTLPKNEQYWLGKIMSFGNKVEIIEPAYLRETLLQKIEEISFLYKS